MYEQNQHIDHIPIVNSFLTTLPEELQATVQKDSPKPVIKCVHDWFDAESKMLHAKKQKELMKQKRIKQLEMEFQMHRAKKQREFQQKFANIEKNKNKNINYIQQKLRKISIRHNKMIVKIQDENLKQMQKQFDSRKAYEFNNSRRSSKLTHTSHQSSPQNKQKLSNQHKTKTTQQQEIQHRMSEIDNRLEKAKTMYRQRKSETVNKARNHNLYDLYHVQVKAKQKMDDYLRNNTTKIMSKMESAQLNKDRIDHQIEKKNKERHKSYSQKLKKIQINLNQLQQEQQLKFQSLSKKLEQTLSKEKGVQQRRQTVYHKKFQDNIQKIEQNKVERANRIIEKHKQISLKNRLFKQKRQSLYKTVKVSPS